MSEIFAEATVHLTPDLTGFVQTLKKDVKAAVEKVEKTPSAKIKISPALTRDFVGNLRKQINLAVAQAQKGIKPVQVRAVLSDTSRAAIAREIRTGAQTVRTTSRPVTGVAGTGAAVTATRDLATANLGLVSTEKILADAARDRIRILGPLGVAEDSVAKSRIEGARSLQKDTVSTLQDAEATTELTKAKIALDEAQLHAAGTSAQAARFRAADAHAVAAIAQATRSGDLVTRQAAEAFRLQIRTIPGATQALDEHSRAARQAASNMSQLRRGVLSTSLSFLGIRGATLAASARFLAGAAAIAVFAKALQNASEFATQLNVFRATTGATAVELERVRDAARALGADLKLPGVTAQDAAESMTELAKAGLGVEDSIAGARGVLQLATAAAIDNAQAVELAANAINAFGLAGRDATHVADVFANAANAAQGSIVDIGIAFQQSAAAGRQVGLSFEDTSTFLTVLARNGLKGSDAGTSLRTALIRLIKPTEKAADELKRLGVETRDAAGNLRPDIFIQLTQATKDLTPAARDAALALVGGQDAFRAITILGRQSIGDFIKLRQQLRQQGTAAELAQARMTGLRGALEGLSNTLSTAGLAAGRSLTPALESVVVGLTGVTVAATQSQHVTGLLAGSVQAVGIAFSALGQTIGAAVTVLQPFAGTLAAIANSIGVPTILAAVVAYKALGAALIGIEAARTGRIARGIEVLRLQMNLLQKEGAVGGIRAFGAALGRMALTANAAVIAITVLAAGMFFLATRETSAERATRKLKEATEGLVAAQEKLNSAQKERRDTGLGVNAAQLGVLDAQSAASAARANLANSNAARGSFARTKLELQLAVALDNVKIAQNGVADAIKRANDARKVALQAQVNAKNANIEEAEAIERVIEEQKRRARFIALGAQRQGASTAASAVLAEKAAVRGLADELKKRADAARKEGTIESINLAERLELISSVAQNLNKLPSEKAIEIAITAPNAKQALEGLIKEFGLTGTKAADALTLIMSGKLNQKLRAAFNRLSHALDLNFTGGMQVTGSHGGEQFTRAAAAAIDKNAPAVLSAVDRLLGQINGLVGQQAGLSVQENLATIGSGAADATLPVLQQELANARQREAKARAGIAASPVGETPSLRKQLRQAIADQASIITQIRGINESLASDAKAAADEATSKQNEIFDNILTAMGVKRDRRQQAIEDAALTEGSADDLSATRKLRQLVNVQIANLQERIRSARKQGKDVSTLIAGLRVLEGIYRELGRTVISLQRARQQEIQDRIAESNQLDIDFAQTTGNKQAEIRARLREINRLKKLQALAKGDILERKRLRNLIADQVKAIEDLRKAEKAKNDAFGRLGFEFLQRQQGFAATLLSNLIPQGALSAITVPFAGGGTTRGATTFAGPQEPRGVAGAAAAAAATSGVATPTRGQSSTQIDLLRQVVRLLEAMNKDSSHPSAKNARKRSRAEMDVHH